MGSLATLTRVLGAAAVAATATFCTSGCRAPTYVMIQTGQFPEPMLFEDALQWTREASDAFTTMHDFDTAREAAYGSLGQLEGLHRLVPDNEDGLFLLNRSWASIAFAFMDDEREQALAENRKQDAEYQKARARAAFKRARFYGEELVNLRFDGYEAALKNSDTLEAWLRENYEDDEHVEELLWLGFSIVGRVAFDQDNPEAVAELWVGVHMLERVVEIDERLENATAHTVLGSYHARGAMGELDLAKKHFDRALELHGGKVLTTQLNLASRYYCMKRDQKSYEKTLNAVLEAGDTLPEERLVNVIAKRRARRYLDHPDVFQDDCAFEG